MPRSAHFVLVLTALLFIGLAVSAAPAPPDKPSREWSRLFKGNLVAVHIERTLSEESAGGAFLIACRVTNVAGRPVGLDLSDRNLLRPNQWGLLNGPRREIVDERRGLLPAPDVKALTAAHRAGKLTVLRAGQSLTFYRQFNGRGSRQDVERARGTHFFVSVSGQLLATDGRTVERVDCSWGGASQHSDTIIPCPVPWRLLPKGAIGGPA